MSLIQDFRELLKWLEAEHRPLIIDKLTTAQLEVYSDLVGVFPPAEAQDLERLLPANEGVLCDFIKHRKFLYLSPNPGSGSETKLPFLPFVSVYCQFDPSTIEARLCVAMARRNDRHELRILGQRFESPEGDGEGLHDFYHCQFIQEFLTVGRPALHLNPAGTDLEWIPTTQPSIPVDAKCPVTLLLVVLVSLYGLPYLDYVRLNTNLPEEYFKSMHCAAFRPNFWKVVATGSITFFKHVNPDEARWKMILSAKLGVKTVMLERCTASQYYAAGEGAQIKL